MSLVHHAKSPLLAIHDKVCKYAYRGKQWSERVHHLKYVNTHSNSEANVHGKSQCTAAAWLYCATPRRIAQGGAGAPFPAANGAIWPHGSRGACKQRRNGPEKRKICHTLSGRQNWSTCRKFLTSLESESWKSRCTQYAIHVFAWFRQLWDRIYCCYSRFISTISPSLKCDHRKTPLIIHHRPPTKNGMLLFENRTTGLIITI